MSISAGETLKKHLVFPLNDGGTSRQDGPIIPDNHPIHDYYTESNWLQTGNAASTINEVVIFPAQAVGLFDLITAANIASAVDAALLTDFDALPANGNTADVLATIEKYVWNCTLKLVEAKTTAKVTASEDPGVYAVFATTNTDIGAFHKTTEAHKRIFQKFPVEADDIFSYMRPYYAYKRIDEIFGEYTNEYYFLKRLVTLTKVVFVIQLLGLGGPDAKAKALVLITWVHSDNLSYSTVDDASNVLVDAAGNPVPRTEKYALDDMFRLNVILSQQVKHNSVTLADTKNRVAGARDNLQSLSNTDSLVKTQRRNGIIVYWVVVALLVLQICSLLAAEYMQSPLVGYMVIVVVAIVVLFIEAKDGIQALVNI